MVSEGVPFLLFQSSGFSENPSLGGLGGLRNSKRAYLMKRLFQFSNLVWRITLEDEELKVILEKKIADSRWLVVDTRQQITDMVPINRDPEHE
jgi:hypothetical protein